MLQEAADEFHDIEVEGAGAFAVGPAVTNAHGAVLDTDDAGVGDGDLEDVGSEVFESGLSGATAWQFTFQAICQTAGGI